MSVIRTQKVKLSTGEIKTIRVKCFAPGEEDELVESVEDAVAKKPPIPKKDPDKS